MRFGKILNIGSTADVLAEFTGEEQKVMVIE